MTRPACRLMLCLASAACAASPFGAAAGEQPSTIDGALELFDQKRFDDAAEALDAIARKPGPPAERQRARTLAAQVRTFKTVWDAGTSALKQRDFETAIREFELALMHCESISPGGEVSRQIARRRLAPTYVLHGNSALEDGRYSKAYAAFKRALQHSPDYAPATKGLNKLGAEAKRLYYEGHVRKYSDLETGPEFERREYPLDPTLRWPAAVQPALQHFDAHEFDRAEAELQAVAASAAPTEVQENAGYLLRQLARFREHWQSGLEGVEAGNHEQAVRDLREAMQRAHDIYPRGRVFRSVAHRLASAALEAAGASLDRGDLGEACRLCFHAAYGVRGNDELQPELMMLIGRIPEELRCRETVTWILEPSPVLSPEHDRAEPRWRWDQLDPDLQHDPYRREPM